jgi:hypothetical protein
MGVVDVYIVENLPDDMQCPQEAIKCYSSRWNLLLSRDMGKPA